MRRRRRIRPNLTPSPHRSLPQEDERGFFPLLAAARGGHLDTLRFLSDTVGLTPADYEGATGRHAPLRGAARRAAWLALGGPQLGGNAPSV